MSFCLLFVAWNTADRNRVEGDHGIPGSLTLGGYDNNRFVQHSTTFNLESKTRQPVVRLRAITAEVTSPEKAPTTWAAASAPLLSFNESVTAVIDSSAPYLSLPTDVCERFAETLGLKWNATLGVYTFSNSAVFQKFSGSDLSFTFSLSSSDNNDNFGQPLNVPGVVNITISANAFAQTLRYPFKNVLNYGDAAIPYFPLTRADNEGEIIIGRAFLQEAYIITDYERSTFSVYKAVFPANAHSNTSIATIHSSPDSPYPGPVRAPEPREVLGTPQIVGIVVGACLAVAGVFVAVLCRRKRKRQLPGSSMREEDELKVMHSKSEPDAPTTPIRRILSKITKPFSAKKVQRPQIHEAPLNSSRAVEIGADSSHERYELPAPMEPAELDASDNHSLHDAVVLETNDTRTQHVYEIARRKMERQLQGPLPEYTPPNSELSLDDPAKSRQDVSRVAHYRPSDHLQADQNPSPASTNDHLPYPYPLPSPMTSLGDWSSSSRALDPLSPEDCKSSSDFTRSSSNPSTSHSLHSPNLFNTTPQRLSGSTQCSPASPTESLQPPSPSHQRTRRASIDPSRVICLGPLPSNIRPPHPSPTRRLSRPNVLGFTMPTISSAQESQRHSAADTLGSNFTMNEISDDGSSDGTIGPQPSGPADALIRLDREDLVQVPQPLPLTSEAVNRLNTRTEMAHVPSIASLPSPSGDRIDGVDVVHVPQPAPKRYSWEM